MILRRRCAIFRLHSLELSSCNMLAYDYDIVRDWSALSASLCSYLRVMMLLLIVLAIALIHSAHRIYFGYRYRYGHRLLSLFTGLSGLC